MIRLIIADDHQLLIEGLIAVLSEVEGIEILPPVNDGRQLISRLQQEPADLVLLDLNMPHLDGIKTLEILRRDFRELRILILTNYNQPQLVEMVKKLGAHGYLLKNSPSHILKDAILKVAGGETWFNPELSPETDTNMFFVDDFMKTFQLTKREVEIIRMVAKEMTSKQIGDELFISEFTVGTHRRNIMRKLEVNNVAGLLKFARQMGLTDQ